MVTSTASALPFMAADAGRPAPAKAAPSAATMAAMAGLRVGIVCNPKAHLNHGAEYEAGVPGADSVIVAAPRTRAALAETLANFAARRIDLLVIDGGDGTVRDVLTAAGELWGAAWPRVVVIPSGKTNALAIDLGIPKGWTLADALVAVRAGRSVVRRPVEIARASDAAAPPLRGFLFGAGVFVDATGLAQHTHRAGAFNGIAVGLALGWAIVQTLFGRASSVWRAGTPMTLAIDGAAADTRARYLLLASTLGRLPLGLKPFGPAVRGLRLLHVDAPPRRLLAAAPAVVAGADAAWLGAAGYHRVEADRLDLTLDPGFILDGELFPGGTFAVRQGPSLSFVVP
jgi:diacylglycerol kinase family enzyme